MPSEPSRAVGLGSGSAAVGSVRRHFLEECRGRHEEEIAGHCPAEVEQPVVIARRTADEHVLEHLLDGARDRL